LNAEQVARALRQLPTDSLDVVVIENVGNLVCPAAFELGEHAKIVVLSTAEGDDKPVKYPGTFAKAKAVLINKIDLLGALEFDIARVRSDIKALSPEAQVFEISARTGKGMSGWYEWLLQNADRA
jgi:hydrogenase nickel incorporation protein HypB